MDSMNLKEACAKWGVAPHRVNVLCRWLYFRRGAWLIFQNAEKLLGIRCKANKAMGGVNT